MKIDIESANFYHSEDLENYLKRLYKQKKLTIEDLQEAVDYVCSKIEAEHIKIKGYKKEFNDGDNRLLYYMLLVHTARLEISKYEAKLEILNEYLAKMDTKTNLHKKTKKKNATQVKDTTKNTTPNV